MIKVFLKLILISHLMYAQLALSESLVKGKILFQDETIHLEFSGKKDWNYSVERKDNKKAQTIQILVDPLDEESFKQFAGFKSSLIKKISVLPKQTDNKTLIIFELAKDLESFDYLVEDPSRLVVDLYQKPTDEKTVKKEVKTNKTETTVAAKSEEQTQKNTRTPATADFLKIEKDGAIQAEVKTAKSNFAGIYDGADPFYERFSMKDYEIKEESIIMSKENYYIPFPDIDLPVEDWKKIKNAENLFEITPKDDPENKHVRLLQTLMNNQRYQVFFKTYNWFFEKYPDSEYSDIVRNMSIQIHLSEWESKKDSHHYDLATQKMRDVISKDPKHPMSEKYSLMLGILAFEKKDYFNSLRSFQSHNNQELWNKKGSFSADLSSLGIALSYLKLNQYEEAYKFFDKLENSSIFDDLKSEAAYRKGDVYLKQKKYDQAIKEYKSAITRRPKEELKFPNAYYNQAQAQFLLEQFKDSLNTYREFIKKFPQDKASPFAMTRVGELLEILGADKTKVMGAYLETYFRNGENPSAIVARLRLLTAKMQGMKPKEIDSTVKEITELAKKSELPGMQQFATVMISEGFQQKKSYDKALNLLIDYYKANPTVVDRSLFSKRIVSNIYEKLESSVEAGNFLSALKIYNEYYDNWLKPSTRLDIKYQVGKAYEQGGVYEPAIKYYSEVLNKVYSYRGTKEGREKLVKEKLPSESLLNLRLAVVEDQNKNYNKSFDYLKAIKEPNLLKEKEQVERILLATELYEKRGDLDSATLYLTELLKYWKGQPELVAEPYYKLSDLELRKGQKDEAIKSLKKIDSLVEDTNLVSADLHRKSLEKLGKIYDENKEFDQAIVWYEKLLEKFEDTAPLASVRYRLGKIYFDIGKIQKASDTWNQFKGLNSESWQKIAKEQLRSYEWKNENKKIIDRLPASEAKP
jgi:tetratricopeptide (TPR) repeat protein